MRNLTLTDKWVILQHKGAKIYDCIHHGLFAEREGLCPYCNKRAVPFVVSDEFYDLIESDVLL